MTRLTRRRFVRKIADAALLTSAVCDPHNLRESMLAYAALVRWRKSDVTLPAS